MYLSIDSSKDNKQKLLLFYRVVAIIVLLFAKYDSFSATSMPIAKTDSVLIAIKGKKQKYYKIGRYLSISYGNQSNKISGQLYEVSNDSVTIMYNPKIGSTKKIAIKDIDAISILHKKGRKDWVKNILILSSLFISGLIIFEKYINNPFAVVVLIFLFPLFAAGTGLILYSSFLLINFMSDIFSKKRIQKGWSFKSIKNKTKNLEE
jgi:hypothetical protein